MFSIYVADRWRVVLKGEYPDYINAVFVNVSCDIFSNSSLI